LTEEALVDPLEIAAHYTRGNDPQARSTALSQAEEEYRAFIERYPENQRTVFARNGSSRPSGSRRTTAAFERWSASVTSSGKRTGDLLVAAAGLAYTQMGTP
jgi:hypothetical protein